MEAAAPDNSGLVGSLCDVRALSEKLHWHVAADLCEGEQRWELQPAEDNDLADIQSSSSDSGKCEDGVKCHSCKVVVPLHEKSSHYQSEWHVANVRRRVTGRKAISLVEFQALNGNESQHETDASDTVDSSDVDAESSEESKTEQSSGSGSALVTFRYHIVSSSCDDDGALKNKLLEFSVFKSVLVHPEEISSLSQQDKMLCYAEKFRDLRKQPSWCVLMISGGRFAGALFNQSECTDHKSFSRYTTRRKQGGSQSTKDSHAGGGHKAKSAGASIRRYNEGRHTCGLLSFLGGLPSSPVLCVVVVCLV